MLKTEKYYFSVEGETEIYYLEWLEAMINASPNKECKVKFQIKKRNPLSYSKNLNVLYPVEVCHIVDYESNEDVHVRKFQETLSKMKKAKTGLKNNKISNYYLGYTNFTFELWIILHKIRCDGSLDYRSQYLEKINQAYGMGFTRLENYKKANNFKRLLNVLRLEDVIDAINRADSIMNHNNEHYTKRSMFKYIYFTQNPSLSLHSTIKKILKDVGIIKKAFKIFKGL